MKFYTASKLERPIRLCQSTRQFAYDSLMHVYGLDTAKTDSVSMDDIVGFEQMSDLEKYDAIIRKIAQTAPIRICDGEMISGAATLGMAIYHKVPAVYKGNRIFESVSHLTVDFETVLRRGINGIRDDVYKSLSRHSETRKVKFLHSCLATIDSFSLWHKRYILSLEKDSKYEKNLQNLLQVPFSPARNFYEAVQSIWFTFAFLRLCGNWPGIGRIDWLLGDYLKKDLADKTLTLDKAREILAHFFIKGCEWIKGGNYESGDAQHYQNIVLSGTDQSGNDITNEVTYLVLDIIEELGISDFPTTIRLSKNTPEKLLRRASEVLRFGGGILAFYNEDLILKSLTEYGYPPEDAWKFANDGCWEVQIPGKTFFRYIPFDCLQILQQKTLDNYSGAANFENFEELYNKFSQDLTEKVINIYHNISNKLFFTDEAKANLQHKPMTPCTAVSIFEIGCIEKGVSYLEGGPVYNIISPHIGGLPDTVNSLYAIKKFVFDEKKQTLSEFLKMLKNNWDGYEIYRRYILNNYSYYGNDNDECDNIAVRILADFAKACRLLDGRCDYAFPAGVSTFGRQLEWMPGRLASAHGHKKGEILAPNYSPTPGSDCNGATAIIRSYCKGDLSKMVTGAALDVKLLPSSVEGDDGLNAIMGLLRGFVALGGYFIQPDIQDKEILKEAQLHPENYQTLSVRVSGWNARFVTLCKEWQDMIINENK